MCWTMIFNDTTQTLEHSGKIFRIYYLTNTSNTHNTTHHYNNHSRVNIIFDEIDCFDYMAPMWTCLQ